MNIQEHIDLKPYTYFKIGGQARYFIEVKHEDELKEALAFAKKKKVPYFVIGAASNILVSDAGFPGLVIRMMLRDIAVDGTRVLAGAGVPNAVLVARTITAGLLGFEWAIGIPGSIGGSVRGNAGCFSGEMKDVVEGVRFLNTKTGKLEERDNAFCRFSYRESIFKSSPHFVITAVALGLRRGDTELVQRMVRHYTRERSRHQDIGVSSAGCIFKNVSWPKSETARRRLISLVPQLMEFSSWPTIPAAFLIDHLGLKGKTIGKASVSKKHANFVVNEGGARAEDIVMLVGLIKEYVHRKYDLHLEEEIQYVGF